jgi:hypothetical protein
MNSLQDSELHMNVQCFTVNNLIIWGSHIFQRRSLQISLALTFMYWFCKSCSGRIKMHFFLISLNVYLIGLNLVQDISVNPTTRLHLLPRLRMRGAIPVLPQYVIMAWCLVNLRDNFLPFTLPLQDMPLNYVHLFYFKELSSLFAFWLLYPVTIHKT